jgi:endo-1,4-beta-D-glucanase Y
VEDPQSASDADVLIAYALSQYSGPDAASLHRASRRVASAILANEAVTLPDGSPLLTAGPWATSASPTINPSYLMPGIFQGLARSTGDSRWRRASSAAVALVAELTSEGRRLPPDWAQLTGGRLTAVGAPDGSAGIQYGADAARLPLWFASACEDRARGLAADWWRNVLSLGTRAGAIALSLDGAIINRQPTPLGLLAAAAAARSAGEATTARRLRLRATTLARRVPTYYGDAWVALAPALLDRDVPACP